MVINLNSLLSGIKITLEMDLWAFLKGIILIMLIEIKKYLSTVGSVIP